MKYKVGDKVRIRSKEWYDKHKDANGEIRGAFFDKDRAKLCGTIQTIANGGFIDGLGVTIYAVEDAYEFIGEEAIEGLVEEEDKTVKTEVFGDTIFYPADAGERLEIIRNNDYQFVDENGNVINATKIVLEKKKKEYPKTYEECCKVLGYDDRETYCIFHTGADERLFEALYNLKVCRDAYWKIVGEEMGLGEPWEPDWLDDDTKKYVITSTKVFETFGGLGYVNYILTFPTKEMRDAFYENFKELINECKKLL